MKYRVIKLCINKSSKGVSLLELIVAIAIFSIVITLVVSLFMTALKGQRRVIALQNAQDNARFLLDFMAKEIRQSTITTLATGPSYSLDITRPDGVTKIRYVFNANNIERNIIEGDGASGPINSGQVTVTGRFFIGGTSGGPGGDNLQPKVTIALKVQTIGSKVEETAIINLQTTLSSRNPIIDL